MEKLNVPTHVGIILDGNRRWAKERGLKSKDGHKAGFETLKRISKYIFKKGVKVLSVFAFSTENFKRSEEEVNYLMNLFLKGFKSSIKEFNENNIKVVFSGRKEPLSDKVYSAMKELESKTSKNNGGILNICLNYGGQAEIVDTTKKIVNEVLNGNIKIDDINEELFRDNLYNSLPYMDLLIRTSGEIRVSNFMLYSIAYAEMYFPSVNFPDFDEKEFDKALEIYNKRDRRMGGNSKN
ncbi:MAG: polyprenyl diphosphate synthase [Tenericutes bacterium]|nr:polyprenyl diphosphate synthase [Mycoplasmatota bacterium]